MHICTNWGGCLSNGKDLLKISFENEEMMIIFFPSTDEEPPALVTRIDSSMSPWPYKKNYQPTYSVVKSNYRDNLLLPVLQKIEVVNASAPNEKTNWKITVSEYKIETDYYEQIPPDDFKKCNRKFFFTLADEKLHLEYREKDLLVKKSSIFERIRKWTDVDNVFTTLTDRRIDEVKAMAVFQTFHREMWMINDSILVQALTEVEKEIQKKEFLELLEIRKTQRDIKDLDQHSKECLEEEELDALITEEELWERKIHDDNNELDALITEDELWERRTYE